MLHLLAAAAAMLTAAGGERPWVDAKPGVHLSEPVTLAPAGRDPSIAPLGDGFLAVWLQSDPDGPNRACLAGRLLTAEGRPAGAVRVLHCGPVMTPPTVVTAGERAAIVWGIANQIEAQILSPDLAPLAELHHPISRVPEHVSASHDGSAFVAAWSTSEEAAALSFGMDGAILRGGPVPISGHEGAADVTNASVACVSSGTCAVLFRHFYGNSQTATGSARLEGGALKGTFGGYPGPFELKAIAGAGRLLLFYSTYDRLLGEDALSANARVFDYEVNEYMIRDIAGASGSEGTLMAWKMEPRWSSKMGVMIGYIHPDPAAAHPHPLAIPNAINPAVATRDGRRFVLLTGTPDAGPIQARLVSVDPSKFASSPAQRGPALEGVVQDPGGRPVAETTVAYYLFLRGGSLSSGTTVTRADGRFSIPHPQRNDLGAGADVTRMVCWAQREGSTSPPLDFKPTGSPVTLHLHPEVPAAHVRLVALSASGTGRYEEDLQVLLAPGTVDAIGLTGLRKGRALELDNVAPGPTVLSLFDPRGFQVTHQIQIQPGADHTVEVRFAVNLPPGKVGLILDESLVVAAAPEGVPAQQAGVRKGDVILKVDGQHPENRNRAVEMLGGPPGTHVTVTVRRGAATHTFEIVRSTPQEAPAPKVTVRQSTKKAPPLIQPAPGERVLAEAAVLNRDASGPFRVDVDEAVRLPDSLRPYVTLPDRIPQEHAISLSVTVEGPGDLHETRELQYYNSHTVHVGCDPVPGGGPNQCDHTTWEESTSPPPIDFGPDLLNMPGTYRLMVRAPGFGQVQVPFLVVPYELGPAYQLHQQRQLGTYRLQARAAVRLPAAPGSTPLTVYRALYRSGDRTLIADVSENRRGAADLEAMLTTGRWSQLPWSNARDHSIKLDRKPGSFEAVWSSEILVRVAGAQLGESEQAVLDYYLGAYPGRQAPR